MPVLFGQGETDSLFPLAGGAAATYDTALTRRAREQSVFVGYNAGHVLPTLLPLGSNPFDPSTLPYSAAADPCSRRGSPAAATSAPCGCASCAEQLLGR